MTRLGAASDQSRYDHECKNEGGNCNDQRKGKSSKLCTLLEPLGNHWANMCGLPTRKSCKAGGVETSKELKCRAF